MAQGCSRVLLLLLAGAASAPLHASRFEDNYELGVRTELFTAALASGRSRDVYWMFCPQFRTENSFARFDSAFQRWRAGRRVRKASRKVVDISGAGGYVSTWVVFEGARDYEYLYASWVRVGRTWQLVWVSHLLNQSFAYGRSDTGQVRAVTETALRYALSPRGLGRFRRGFVRPETLLMLSRDSTGARPERIDSTPVRWLSLDELRRLSRVSGPRFVMAISGLRVLGTVATVTVDLLAGQDRDAGSFGRKRGQELYLELKKGRWQFNSVGKAW
jgi:hypothetical protein